MDPKQKEQAVAAVLIALGRVDLTRAEQIELLEGALERLRVMEEVDESALLQIVGGMNLIDGMN